MSAPRQQQLSEEPTDEYGNWYYMKKMVLPKQSRLDLVQQKQKLFKSRLCERTRSISRSYIDGSRARVNPDSYFYMGQSKIEDDSFYSCANADEEEGEIEQRTDRGRRRAITITNECDNNSRSSSIRNIRTLRNLSDNNSPITSSAHLKLPQLLGQAKKFPSSVSFSPNGLKLPPLLSDRTNARLQHSPTLKKFPRQVSIDEFSSEGESSTYNSDFKVVVTATTIAAAIEAVNSSPANLKLNQLKHMGSFIIHALPALNMQSQLSILRGAALSITERLRGFLSSLKDLELRFLAKIEQDIQLKSGLFVLTGLKPLVLCGLLAKLYRICGEKVATKLVASQSKVIKLPQQIDPVSNLNGLSLTTSLAGLVEAYFQLELARSGDFINEKDTFHTAFCEVVNKYLHVDDILLSFGGVASVQAIIIAVSEKLSQHFLATPLVSETKEIIGRIGIPLFQGSLESIRQVMANLYINLDRVRIADFFIVKHFIFQELLKSDNDCEGEETQAAADLQQLRRKGGGGRQNNLKRLNSYRGATWSSKYLPGGSLSWHQKCLLLEKIELLRYGLFRHIFNLPSEAEVNLSIRELIEHKNSQQLDVLLKTPTIEGRVSVLQTLARNFLGAGSPRNLLEDMRQEGVVEFVFQGSSREEEKSNQLTKALIIAESLLSASFLKSHSALCNPHWTKKVLEVRFTELRRKLGLLGSPFDEVTISISSIISKVTALANQLVKYIDDVEEKKKSADTRLFAQLLVEVSQKGDTFAIEDLSEGLKYYGILDRHFAFWMKVLRRVLASYRIPQQQALQFTLLINKLYEDAKKIL